MPDKNKRTTYADLKGAHRTVPIILYAVAAFIGICFITGEVGAVGGAVSRFLLGLFSYAAYGVPFLLLLHGIFYPSDISERRILSRIIFSLIALITVSSLIYAIGTWGQDASEVTFSASESYKNGKLGVGGGFVGSAVAFCIIKAFDYVGLVIIAAAVFAIYLSFFFAGNKGGVKKAMLGILKGILTGLVYIERGFKRLFGGLKSSKTRKESKRLLERNEALGDDDFFAVDNGMQKLEIAGLGIAEERSRAAVEERPTLSEKVHHKSAVKDEEKSEAHSFSNPYYDSEVYKAKRIVTDNDIEIDYDESGDEPQPYRSEQASPFGATPEDESAESVFGSDDFDPFSDALNEALRDKRSGKGPVASEEDPFSVTERLGGISEEEINRARRREAFEKKKAQLVGMNKAKEVLRKAGEELAEHKTVEFHSSESEDIQTDSDRPTVSIVIDKVEQDEPVNEETINVPTYTAIEKEPVAEEPRAYEPVRPAYNSFSNLQRTQSQYQRAAQFSVAAQSTASDNAPTKTVYESFPAEEKKEKEITVSVFSTDKEKKEEGSVEFKDYNVSEEKKGLVFEYDEEEIESLVEEKEEPTLNVELSRITENEYDYEDEDEEEELDEASLEADEEESLEADEDFDEEIPPEKQNPVVIGYRDMFSALREEDARRNEALDEESYDEDTDENEEDSNEEEVIDEDEPPFDDYEPPVERQQPKPVENKPKKKADFRSYKKPPMELMGLDEVQDDSEIYAEINENTRILIETLESFGVTASIKGVDRGPRITRYEVVPAKGVKVKEITHLFSDIELNLATEGIRMEAPIPGKSAIGFEIPNKRPANVRLRELLETDEFLNAKSNTYVCIGKDVAGNPVFGDIAKYPHLLVAGATGMGKSVCINSLMISMLYKARPDEVKFIMIDPKKVEFKMYSGIPHLLIPVITESKQAAGALMWAVEEMERRYDLIESSYVRNIEAYNEKVKADPSFGEYLPKIVIVIDELNDLMMQVRDPVENLIMRIAQKARAAGIHLIIGTQRPSVNVITGTIKANINTRISCKVTSNVDSRTILEMAGAEKLLNKGDMLYKPVDRTKPLRVQGAFVSDPEVEAIMNFLKAQSSGEQYDDEVFAEINRAAQKCGKKGGSAADDDGDDGEGGASYYSDPQFLDAVELAIRSGKISTSLLQRKCSIGYGKAAKYIDMMEEIGVVSEPNGQKPRDILISMDEWHEKLSRVSLD